MLQKKCTLSILSTVQLDLNFKETSVHICTCTTRTAKIRGVSASAREADDV